MGLSIIIPCYNAEKTIIRSIQSIINQSTDDLDVEIIVIDDCSSDNSWCVLQEYRKNCRENLRIYRNENNIGAGKTRNKGIQLATKEYISFLDSDDELSSDYESTLLECMKLQTDIIIYNATIKQIDGQEKKLKMFYSRRTPKTGQIDNTFAAIFTKGCTCGKVYKLDLLLSNDIEFSALSINEDTVFTKKALLSARSFYYVDKELYIYNYQENSLMHTVEISVEQATQAYNEISQINKNDERLNSIFFLEVLYAGTKALIFNSDDFHMIRKQFTEWKKTFKIDKNFLKYEIKYIIFYCMCSINMFGLIKRIMR